MESNLKRNANEFFLDDPLLEEIKEEILNLDINITPMEALMKLNEIKRMLTENNFFILKLGYQNVSFY
jgi:hypothetical protein